MLAAFGVDVLDPRTSLRRVHVLLDRLPPHARSGGRKWSTETEMLANLVDYVAFLTWVTLRANGAKSAKMPKPVRRPEQAGAKAPAYSDSRNAPPAAQPGGEPVKTASWGAALAAIAGAEGVRVRRG